MRDVAGGDSQTEEDDKMSTPVLRPLRCLVESNAVDCVVSEPINGFNQGYSLGCKVRA